MNASWLLVWELVPFILALVAFRWSWLWPSALITCAFSDHHRVFLLILCMIACFLLAKRKDKFEVSTLSRSLIQVGFLVGLAITWPDFERDLLTLISVALVPVFLLKPLAHWLYYNSGGALFLNAFVVFGWLMIYRDGPHLLDGSVVLGCMLVYLMLLMAWYRQIPIILKVLWLNSAIVAAIWVIGGQLNLMILMMGFLMYAHFDKWLWGQRLCLLSMGVWAQAALIALALFLSAGSSTNTLHLCFTLGLVFMSSQEVCRLCVASAKCREVVLSWWTAKCPLLYLLLILLGLVPSWEVFILLCFTGLSQEVSRALSLKPIKIGDLSENPCLEEFKLSLSR